jgi:hypothetical protein
MAEVSATLKHENGVDLDEGVVESKNAVVKRVDWRNGED